MKNIGEKIEQHESYAMLNISRVQNGSGKNLFGSSIIHNNTITLKIKPAEVKRDLHRDWYHSVKTPYIEVEMSYSQFAEAITSLNCYEGVPVTLKYLNGKQIEQCPEVNKRQEFDQEIQDEMEFLNEKLLSLTNRATEILSSSTPIRKSEKEEILNSIKMLHQEIEKNIPFIQTQFNEQMDKTVLEAKGEVEGFITNKIVSAGLQGLQKEMKLLREDI